ncbi:hypothetical protein ABZW03_19655 [Kitasatospora sp. NPDC004799]|uniref:hypothetical protein n=1 Tax=Kitasatospora sp. NPDC004799 TaxID=3154460 RepID=UPI0033A53A86
MSPLALALPAQAAGQDNAHSVRIEGFPSVEAGGGWSEGTVTVKNDADAPYAGQHLVIYFGTQMLGKDQVAAEYADGASGSWQPVKLVDQDLGAKPAGYQGVATDLTGAGVEVQPHSARTFKLRFKLLQSTHAGPEVNVSLYAYLAPTFGADGQAKDWTVQAPGVSVKTTGLTTSFTGLPTSVPADGKPHAFQVSIKTANGFDWHLTSAAFFVWGGQKYGSMDGQGACAAQLDVQDPKDKTWHKVGMGAVGAGDGDVDLTKWATGPVDNRVLNARLTLGKNVKTDTDASLGFGYYPGASPMLFWAMQPIAAVPVEGAPECVDPNAPIPSPSTSSAPAVVPAAVSTTEPAAQPRASAPVKATDTNRAELADTGSRGLGLTTGIGGALVVAGGAALVLTRRARRS